MSAVATEMFAGGPGGGGGGIAFCDVGAGGIPPGTMPIPPAGGGAPPKLPLGPAGATGAAMPAAGTKKLG